MDASIAPPGESGSRPTAQARGTGDTPAKREGPELPRMRKRTCPGALTQIKNLLIRGQPEVLRPADRKVRQQRADLVEAAAHKLRDMHLANWLGNCLPRLEHAHAFPDEATSVHDATED